MKEYVHGYTEREAQRLRDQSGILEQLLHSQITYPAKSRVLEAGCGVGAQTVILSRKNPQAQITSIDISAASLSGVRDEIARRGISNVCLLQSDVMHLPFANESFDYVFMCFVAEHLDDPLGALEELRRILKKGGSITIIEGDHGSCFWHPQTEASQKVWRCMIDAQAHMGHNSLIGRRLHPLLTQARFKVREVKPLWVYADAGNPDLLDGVVNKIIIPMVRTARERSLQLGLIDSQTWENGIGDLRRSGQSPDGTFFYTWFGGIADK